MTEIFTRDPNAESRAVYGTDDPAHPGVAYLLGRPTRLVAGPVKVLPLAADLPFAEYRFTPRQLRERIAGLGWKRVAGFQTRNPIHRAHEHLTKLALEVSDGLVIHPLVGETKQDDVPAAVRFKAHEALVAKYYPKDRTVLAAFPAAMRYAGPREAIFHAIARKNYGINQLIVGRDHAGVGKYYEPLAAQRIFDQFEPNDLGVTPLRLDSDVLLPRLRHARLVEELPARRELAPRALGDRRCARSCERVAVCPRSSRGLKWRRCCARRTSRPAARSLPKAPGHPVAGLGRSGRDADRDSSSGSPGSQAPARARWPRR